MNKELIPQIARENLSDFLDKAGGILYSGHETLTPGAVYLLGFNPGGTGGKSLGLNIDSMLSNTDNSYLDEVWENGKGECAKGEAPLQKRVQWVLESIGLNPKEVCASNLIFLQSRQANDISYALAEKCWPVHEAILNIVQPKLIIAFGNSKTSPFGYMHSMFGGDVEYFPSGHGDWSLKGFNCQIGGRSVYIAGLPHLSRYSPINKSQVVEWLSKHI